MAHLQIVRLVVLLAVCLIPTLYACGGWINNWDGPLEFECPGVHQFVSHIESVHNNHKEDRRFKMRCRRIPRYVRHCTTRCRWTGYLNNWDDLLFFNCGRTGYINGFRSVHHNHYEDRRWRVRCCNVRGLYLYDCTHTRWTNNWDGRQYYNTPSGQITNGVLSWHKNRYEDRRMAYRICKARKARTEAELTESDNIDIPAIEESNGDKMDAGIPAIEEMSVDRSNAAFPSIEESSGDGRNSAFPANEESSEDGSYIDTPAISVSD